MSQTTSVGQQVQGRLVITSGERLEVDDTTSGGRLGAAVLTAGFKYHWLRHGRRARTVELTDVGRRHLAHLVALD